MPAGEAAHNQRLPAHPDSVEGDCETLVIVVHDPGEVPPTNATDVSGCLDECKPFTTEDYARIMTYHNRTKTYKPVRIANPLRLDPLPVPAESDITKMVERISDRVLRELSDGKIVDLTIDGKVVATYVPHSTSTCHRPPV